MNAEVLWSFDRSEANSKVPLLESNAGFGKGSAQFSKVSWRFPALSLFLALKVNIILQRFPSLKQSLRDLSMG